MKLDPTKINIAPLVGFYNLPDKPADTGLTTEEVIFQFRTTREAAEALLPEPFKVPEVPIVTVCFSYFADMAFLNGGEYGISGVYVHGRFDGEEHHVDGYFAAVLPENNNTCILSGRDIGGNAKFHFDIARPTVWTDGTVIAEVKTQDGSLYYGVQLNGGFDQLKRVEGKEKEEISAILNSNELFALKVIMNNDDGSLDINAPISIRAVRTIDKCWVGKTGRLEWGLPRKKFAIENASAKYLEENLPVEEIIATIHWTGILDWVTGSYTLR